MLLAFDPGTTCGYAAYEALGAGHHPRIVCGSFTAKGETEAQLFADAARNVRDMIETYKPRRIAIELRVPSMAGGIEVPDKGNMFGGNKWQSIRNDASVKRQDGIRAIILALIGLRRPSWGLPDGIPYEEVAASTWRSSFFGKGTKPPASVAKKDRRKWWKKQAREHAEALGLKMGFDVPSDDAAEAVGIAFYLAAHAGFFDARDRVAA